MKSAIQSLMLIVALVCILGGIAFLRQWIATPTSHGSTPETKASPLVKEAFQDQATKVQLESDYEAKKPGYHDFAFENRGEVPMEVGLESKSCRCARIEVLALTPQERQKLPKFPPTTDAEAAALPEGRWQSIEDDHTAVVPAGAPGLVRLNWEGKEPGPIRLRTTVWLQARGQSRGFQDLEVAVNIVPPLQVYPQQLQVGDLGPDASRSLEMWCWSSTRPAFPLTAKLDAPNPLVTCLSKALTPQECQELQARLNEGSRAKVLCGYRIQVDIQEHKDGRQLDIGPLYTKVLLHGPDEADISVDVTGMVRGDVRIAIPDDRDRIGLHSFPAAYGTSKEVPLETGRSGVELVIDEQSPAYLQVELKKDTTQPGHGGTRWMLKVTVPPRLALGRLPADSRVVLKTQDKPPRRIQIPVTGNAYR